MLTSTKAKKELAKYSQKERSGVLQGFFKTGKGEYGEGDIFIGVYVPNIRKVAKEYISLSLSEIEKLLSSKIHEERLLALLILVLKYKCSTSGDKKEIYNFYLNHTKYINNWDLVDLSAKEIVGDYLIFHPKEKTVLKELAESEYLWNRRISIIATYAFILNKSSVETFEISKLLLKDKQDLIHKAVGWMLREVGKRIGRNEERTFLDKYSKNMPRTMLRYAIEHFDKEERYKYLEIIKS